MIMNFKKSVVAAAAVCMLFTVGACKKSAENTEASAPAALAAAANWNKADVNGLLNYIPAESSVVYASTRNFDINSPELKILLDASLKMIDKSMKMIDDQIAQAGDNAEMLNALKASKAQMEESVALVKDYKNVAPQWGLDVDGRTEEVVYVNDGEIVMHMSVVDSKKFESKINAIIDAVKVADESFKIERKTIGEGDNAWTVISIPDMTDAGKAPLAIAVHYGKTLVSAAVATPDVTVDELAKVLKPADKAITKDALGKIEDDMLAAGYIDNIRVLNLLVSEDFKPVIENAFDTKLEDVCINDVKDILTAMPRTNMSYRLLKDGSVSMDSTLVLADKAEAAKLAGLHAPSMDVMNAKSLAGLKLNLNLDKTLTYIVDLSAKLGAKNYQCGAISEMTQSIKELTELATPEIRSMIAGVSGINLAVNDFVVDEKKIDAVIDITGSAIGTTVPGLLEIAKAASPELAAMINLKKDEATSIDLTALVNMPLVVNAIYTDTDLVLATAQNDVTAISKNAKSDRKNFMELAVSMALAKLADPNMDLGDMNYTITLGSNDEGIASSVIMKF